MSDSRHGGRDAAVREYDTGEPIRGRIVYADGTHSAFTYSRLVNGTERKVAHVEVDGEVFSPADGGRIAELKSLALDLRGWLAYVELGGGLDPVKMGEVEDRMAELGLGES